ncbi:hypothetical protein HK096_003179 [Nowakowskiella sp. JEL0078]|nr:hypothetical protein HK096_003179 [Nowakowskiella sp. JEL0078]
MQTTFFISQTSFGAGLAYNFFSPHISNVRNLALYSSQALAFSSSPDLIVSRPYPSFFLANVDGGNVTVPTDQKATLYSSYFNVNVSTLAQLNSTTGSQNTTILDNILRPLKIERDDVELVYFGFEDFGFRNYPYRFDDTYKNISVCNDPSLPDNLVNRKGFIPACRRWYQDALKAAYEFDPSGLGHIVIGFPYYSASTKAPTITVSQAIVNGTQLKSVAAIDIKLAKFIDAFNKSNRILKNGFTFLMTSDGNVVT